MCFRDGMTVNHRMVWAGRGASSALFQFRWLTVEARVSLGISNVILLGVTRVC